MSKRKPKQALTRKADDYQPTEQDIALVRQQADRSKQRAPAPKVKLLGLEDNVRSIEPDHPDHTVWRAGLEESFGTTSWDVARGMLAEVIRAVARDPEELPDGSGMRTERVKQVIYLTCA